MLLYNIVTYLLYYAIYIVLLFLLLCFIIILPNIDQDEMKLVLETSTFLAGKTNWHRGK